MKQGKKQNALSEKVKALATTLAQIDKQFVDRVVALRGK